VIYLLLVIKEFRLASLSVFLVSVGVFFTGVLDSFSGLIISTLLMSIGFHYFETTNTSLSLQYFSKKDAPFLMASIKKISAFFAVITASLVWVGSIFLSYKVMYFIFASVTFIIAIIATFKYCPKKIVH
jgi:divalent metal cation (Fe/Co/Zn/Cd) transporter